LQVIIPVYNEGPNFERLYGKLCASLPQPYRLLVVYDFDEDDTLPVARRIAARDPRVILVRNPDRGFVGAIRAGFEAAEPGPCLVVMADLSDDLSVVPEMVRRWQEGYQVVCASRYAPGGRQNGGPLLKRTLSRAAGLSFRALTGIATHDITNNFRLYDRTFVMTQGIDSRAGCEVALELTMKAFAAGAPITEVPAIWNDRTAGQSRFRLWKWLPHYLRWYAWGLGRGLVRRRLWRRVEPQTRTRTESI
jgi:glycosyltransferase involved in cell wall biosynthesis